MAPRERSRGGLRGLEALASSLRGEVAPVYLFVGDDRREIEDAILLAEATVVDPAFASLSTVRLRGGEHSVADVLASAGTLAFGGGRRLVVLREPERLGGDVEPLLAYLAKPNPSTCLLAVPATFDRRLRLSKALEQAACVVAFDPPTSGDLAAWVRRRLEPHGVAATPEALTLLSDLVQAETLLLGNEIEKLALYCASKKVIEREDVEALLGRTRSADVFQLTNAVEDGDAPAAALALRRLLEQGAAVPMIVGMLDWCLGRLLASERPQAPPSRQQVLERRRHQLRGRAGGLYAALRAADRLFRTSGGNAEAALEQVVLAAAGGRSG